MQLHILQRKPKGEIEFDAHPNAVKEWVAHLPVVNTGETTRLLYRALCDMNAQDISSQHRFKALELLRPSVFYVLDAMKKHIIGQSFPLTDKARKVALLIQELLREMGDSYKIVVMEEASGGGSRRDRQTLPTTIHRALRCLGHQLLRAYQVYAPFTEGVWADLHQLYQYAETHKLLDLKVADDQDPDAGSSTIADVYKQNLLLALACPYRMRQGEVELVYEKLARWAPHSVLAPLKKEQASNGLFVVNLAIDDPPTYLGLGNEDSHAADCRLLDTSTLAEDIREALVEKREHKATNALTESALRRLMLAWGVMPKRRFSRSKESAKVTVAMGLSATHFFVSGEAAFSSGINTPQADDTASRSRFDTNSLGGNKGELPAVWELEPTGLNVAAAGIPRQATADIPTGQAHEKPESYRAREWKMINVSAGGYCLLWDSMENSHANVGELVGIRESDDPDTFHWRLGVIRWMKCNTGLELGVQMLSPGAVAVGARPYPATTQDPRFMRGLLLPEIHTLNQPATLLMPSPPFRLGGMVIINSHGRDVKVKLTKLVENTGAIGQFQFETIADTTRSNRAANFSAGDDSEESPFDELWDSI